MLAHSGFIGAYRDRDTGHTPNPQIFQREFTPLLYRYMCMCEYQTVL